MSAISVLYIEDDEDEFVILDANLKSIFSDAEEKTFEVTWAKTFIEGLHKYVSGKFDICLLDYQLEEKNAHEFLSCIKLYMNQTPVIVLTGHNETSLDISLMECGVRAYFPKEDMSASLLERTLRYVLEQFRSDRADVHVLQPWIQAGSKKVLCIEDDLDDFEIIKYSLLNIKTANYSLKHVATLHDGLSEYCSDNHYDACLLDYKIGNKNALEMLYELREDVRRIPIIMLTGYDDLSLDKFSMELGISGFLSKADITTKKLERMLRYVIHYAAGNAVQKVI